MSQNSPRSTPEIQKYLEANELHDDKKLSVDVEKFQKLIVEGNISELKNQFKNYRVDGIGSLETAITGMDLLNRAKGGESYLNKKRRFYKSCRRIRLYQCSREE